MEVVIFPVAYDLMWVGGKAYPGPGTQECLEKALEVAKEQTEESTIFLSAGWSEEFQCEMAEVMAEYIFCSKHAVDVKVVIFPAETFNTEGEIIRLITFLQEKNIAWLYVVNKSWHMPRTKFLLWVHMPLSIKERIHIETVRFTFWSSDVFREFVAFPQNIVRILWRNILSLKPG